jgi:hypothetical protein
MKTATGVTIWRATRERYAHLETVYIVDTLGRGKSHHYSHDDAERCARGNRDYGYNVRTSMRTETREVPRYLRVE